MPNLGYTTFESRWVDHSDVIQLVRDLCVGEVLNFPSGASPVGDFHASYPVGGVNLARARGQRVLDGTCL